MIEAQGVNNRGMMEFVQEVNRAQGPRGAGRRGRGDRRSFPKSVPGSGESDDGEPQSGERQDQAGHAPGAESPEPGAVVQSAVMALMCEQGWQGMEKPDSPYSPIPYGNLKRCTNTWTGWKPG